MLACACAMPHFCALKRPIWRNSVQAERQQHRLATHHRLERAEVLRTDHRALPRIGCCGPALNPALNLALNPAPNPALNPARQISRAGIGKHFGDIHPVAAFLLPIGRKLAALRLAQPAQVCSAPQLRDSRP